MGKARRRDQRLAASLADTQAPPCTSSLISTYSSTSLLLTGSCGTQVCEQPQKFYLKPCVLQRRHFQADLFQLVNLPPGLGYNEWLASHTVDFFQHINLIYGTISEFCTATSCPDMIGPYSRHYVWIDDRGKKVRTTAAQYIDYVMTFIQKTVNEEALFPSRLVNDFPVDFEAIVRRIFKLLFHVLAHIYHSHFSGLLALDLHSHLNCVFAHLCAFNSHFRLIDDSETEVLHDLMHALKLEPSPSSCPPCSSPHTPLSVSVSSTRTDECSDPVISNSASTVCATSLCDTVICSALNHNTYPLVEQNTCFDGTHKGNVQEVCCDNSNVDEILGVS